MAFMGVPSAGRSGDGDHWRRFLHRDLGFASAHSARHDAPSFGRPANGRIAHDEASDVLDDLNAFLNAYVSVLTEFSTRTALRVNQGRVGEIE